MVQRSALESRLISAHPYRDTALVYAVISVLLVGVAWLTGGDPLRAAVVAVIFFVVATVWSWWKFRGRIKSRDTAGALAPPAGSGGEHADGNGTGSTL
jgi:uncharacterized membrane protein YphA (DoxX/SURF4 family)